jgi:hypothetical protein
MIPIRGGSEAFSAYSSDPGATLDVGSRVIVVDFDPPRNVYVTLFHGAV